MSLSQLDQFLSLRESIPLLAQRLLLPCELEDFFQLALELGFQLTESDVLDAQKRAMDQGSASSLQRAQAEESRRLRNFIHG